MVLRQFLEYKHRADDQSIEPMMVRGTVPLCMEQHLRMFSTTRVPGRESDTIVHLDGIDEKRHVVVQCNGTYYRLDCYQPGPIVSQATLLTAKQLEHRLNIIATDGDDCARDLTNKATGRISSLTTMNRTRWAELREDHLSFGLNRVSLSVIECVPVHFPILPYPRLRPCLGLTPCFPGVIHIDSVYDPTMPAPLVDPTLPRFATPDSMSLRPTAQDRDDGCRALRRKAIQQRRDGEAFAGASRVHLAACGWGDGGAAGSTAPPTLTSDPCFPLLHLIVERLEHLV